MWNYYVQGNSYQGYNIGIDVGEFLKTFKKVIEYTQSVEINYGKIIYNVYHQNEYIDKHLHDVEENIKNTIKENVESEYCNIREMLKFINTYSCFFKDSHFSDEKEFRISIQFDGTENIFENPSISEEFCVKNGLIVPFINIDVPINSIKEVTISPIMESNIAQNSIDELLKHNSINNISVTQSSIPIRF